jgi:hypothetical protein
MACSIVQCSAHPSRSAGSTTPQPAYADEPPLFGCVSSMPHGRARTPTPSDVGYSTGVVHMRHPDAGDLRLHRTRLDVTHSGGQLLLIYHAEPGSESAHFDPKAAASRVRIARDRRITRERIEIPPRLNHGGNVPVGDCPKIADVQHIWVVRVSKYRKVPQ